MIPKLKMKCTKNYKCPYISTQAKYYEKYLEELTCIYREMNLLHSIMFLCLHISHIYRTIFQKILCLHAFETQLALSMYFKNIIINIEVYFLSIIKEKWNCITKIAFLNLICTLLKYLLHANTFNLHDAFKEEIFL